jgi:hypothetical protein
MMFQLYWISVFVCAQCYFSTTTQAFVIAPTHSIASIVSYSSIRTPRLVASEFYSSSAAQSAGSTSEGAIEATKSRKLYPAVGDVVRYYDLDGGNPQGQLCVGKITYIQKNMGQEKSGWTLEVTPLQDIGSGYFADYSTYQQRQAKVVLRDLLEVSPLAFTFVMTQDAYKISLDVNADPIVRHEKYDFVGYKGPFSGATKPINTEVVATDAQKYDDLKQQLLVNTALFGLVGSLLTGIVRSTEDAVVYSSGVAASLAYLYLLSIKTDTVATPEFKLGNNVSNLRFLTPLVPLLGVALYNQVHPPDPLAPSAFSVVTAGQFLDVTCGFLSYRIPLFVSQFIESNAAKEDVFIPTTITTSAMTERKITSTSSRSDTSTTVPETVKPATSTTVSIPPTTPGKVSLASATATLNESIAMEAKPAAPPVVKSSRTTSRRATTVLLVSGPMAAGRSPLVDRFVEESNGKFVLSPFASKEAILEMAKKSGPDAVVVVDTDVESAIQLSKVDGIRAIPVFVTLNSIEAFERKIDALLDDMAPLVDEGRAIEVRVQSMKVVSQIEKGMASGIFEFTIVNDNVEQSLKELRAASAYCFK